MVSESQKHKLAPELCYPAVGKCIYCKSESYINGGPIGGLTKEHILSRGIFGREILPEASCFECQKITSHFEGAVLQGPLGNFRLANELPSYTKKRDREKKLARGLKMRFIDRNGKEGQEMVPHADWPNHLPRIMFGNYSAEKFVETEWIVTWGTHLEDFRRRRGWQKILYPKMTSLPFARLLAKTGHAWAVKCLGLDGFSPLALDLILGRSKDYSYLIGGQIETEEPRRGFVYDLQVNYRKSTDGRRQLIWVRIRLFSDTASPTYVAVVGEVDGLNQEHIETMNRVLTDAHVTLDPSHPYGHLPARPTLWDPPQEEVEEQLRRRTVPSGPKRS